MHKAVLHIAPTVEPVSVPEAKTHLNVTSSSKDTYIQGLVTASRRQIERYLNRALITQTWDLYLPNWSDCIKLPYAPLQSVTSITYKNVDGDDTALTIADYFHVVTSDDPGRLIRKYDVTLPEVEYGNPNAIVIRFVAGYGLAESVPEEIKHAMKLVLTDLYDQRGTVVIGNIAHKIPGYLTDLVHSYKIYSF
jgi:uncharacterized phiE125 gp8 family phage protein